MKLTPPILVSAVVLIGAVGFFVGRISSSDADTAAEGPQITRSPSRASGPPSTSARDAATALREKNASRSPLSETERLSRLEAIIRSENLLDRSRALLAFIDQLGPGDFEAAVARFRSLGLTGERTGEYAMLLSAWAKADPLTALVYAKENTSNRFATDTILTTWASLDPDAALLWASANHSGDGANPYMAGIIRGLAASDPQRATALLTAMPFSRERGEALDAILPYLLSQGNETTRAWISSITDDALRNGAMMRSAERLAANDPEGTVSWLMANPSEATQRRIDNVYSAWAQKDQQAAINSLANLPAGEIRSDALRGVITSVAVADPPRAVSLMDRFPADVNIDVVRNFIWHSFGNDPALAVSQISRIGNTGQREQMYRRTLDRWLERDPTTATQWIQSNPLPEPVQQHLQQRLSQ